eukprot:TRINITY_DN39313_c0_g1_i2.p1 TRINITY_DN39313_c0_g1~~TRINITY_DN39313_c0_g1_i2.p1  ORF type:complete len:266 (-),score=50.87 TRINITY_DN39313_c0_g1_i2:90-887(-)
MGQLFQQSGVLFIAPDYRNFPEVTVGKMVNDVQLAVQWVFDNLEDLGGDPENITLMGQSAGAHLSALALLRQAELQDIEVVGSADESEDCGTSKQDSEDSRWKVADLRRWIGISGPYDIVGVLPTMKNRGLPMSVIQALMDQDLAGFSPTRRIRDLSIADPRRILERLPEAHLFHGTADETCHWQQSEELAKAWSKGPGKVTTKYYPGKSHTDPILEDPISGPGDELMIDLLELVAPDRNRDSTDGFWRPLPDFLLRWAKIANPF